MNASREALDAWLRTAVRNALQEGHDPIPPPQQPEPPIIQGVLVAVAARRWLEAAEMARLAPMQIDAWPLATEFFELAARLPVLIRVEKRHPGMDAHLREEIRALNDVLALRPGRRDGGESQTFEWLHRHSQLSRLADERREELGEPEQRPATCNALAADLERLRELAAVFEVASIHRAAESSLLEILAEMVQLAAGRGEEMRAAEACGRYMRAWRKAPSSLGVPDLSHDPPEWTLLQCGMIGEQVGYMHAHGILHGTLLFESFAWNAALRNFGKTEHRPRLEVSEMAEDLRLLRPQMTDRQWAEFCRGYLKTETAPGHPRALELADTLCAKDAVPENALLAIDFKVPHFVVRARAYALRNFARPDLTACLVEAQQQSDFSSRIEALTAFAADYVELAPNLADEAVRLLLSELRRAIDADSVSALPKAIAHARDALSGTITPIQELLLTSLSFEVEARLARDPADKAAALSAAGTLLLRSRGRSGGAHGVRLMLAGLGAAPHPPQRGEIAMALMHSLLDRVLAGAELREVSQALRSLPPSEAIPTEDLPRIEVYRELCRTMLESDSARANERLAAARVQASRLAEPGELLSLLDQIQGVPTAATVGDEVDVLHPALREIMPRAVRLFGRGEYYRVIELLDPVLQKAEEENADLEIRLPLVGTIASALHQLADFAPEQRRSIAAGVTRLLDCYARAILEFAVEGQPQARIGASAASNLGLAAVSLYDSTADPSNCLEEATALLERAVALCPRSADPGNFSIYANNLSLAYRQRANHEDQLPAIEHLRRAEGLLREVIEVDESFAGSSDARERSLWQQRDIDEMNLGLTALDLARATDDATWISKRPLESARWYRAAALGFSRASEAANAIHEHARHGTAEGNLARVLLDICKHYVKHVRWAGGDVKREFYEWLCEFAGERVNTRILRECCASRALGAAMRSAQAGVEVNPSLMRESLALMAEMWSLAEVHRAVSPRLALHILMSILETLESVLGKSSEAIHLPDQDKLTDFRQFLEGVLHVELFRLGAADSAALSTAHAVFSRLTRSSSAILRALARPRSRWLDVNTHDEGGVTVNGLFLGRFPKGLEVRIPAQHRRLIFRGVSVKTCLPHLESLTTLKGETARGLARMTPNLDWNDVPATLAVADARVDGCRVLAMRVPVPSWDVWALRWLPQKDDEVVFEIDLPWIGVLDQTTNRIDPALPATIDSGLRCLLFGEPGLTLEIALPSAEEGVGRVSAEPVERGHRVRFIVPGILCTLKATPRIAGSDVAYVVKDDHPLAALCCAASFPLDLPGATLAPQTLRSFAPLFFYAAAPPLKALDYLNQRDVHEIVLVGMPENADECDAMLEALFDPRREIFLLVEETEMVAAAAAVKRLTIRLSSELAAPMLGIAASAIHVIEPFSGIQIIACPRELAAASAQMLLDLAAIRRRPVEGIPFVVDGRETYVEMVGNQVGPLRDATLLRGPSTWRKLAVLYVERRDQSMGKAIMAARAELGEMLHLATPQIARRTCVFLPDALTAVLACVPWVRHLGAIPLPSTENGRELARLLGHSGSSQEFPAEPGQIAAQFQTIVRVDHDQFLERVAQEAGAFVSSLALLKEMSPAEYLVLCTVAPGESAWGWLAANYAAALGAPLLPFGPEVLEGATDLIDAGSKILAGPSRGAPDQTRAFVLRETARRVPDMTNAVLKNVIAAVESLQPRFVGFVSACTGFPLELVGAPPLATRFAVGRLAGPDLLSTSLLIARAALSEDAARPATLSVFLAEASDVPGHDPLEGAAREVAALAGILEQDTALQIERSDGTNADLEQFREALAHAHLLHFAGHGFYDDNDPLESGLMFRGGLLSARDLPAALAGAPLIFGNACESASLAGGSAVSTRGWSGLAASLIAAGASNYVGSLWPVGDASAQRLAVEFYQQLLRGYGVGEALRKARQACYSDSARHDPTWAAFVLFGCPRNRFRHHTPIVAPP